MLRRLIAMLIAISMTGGCMAAYAEEMADFTDLPVAASVSDALPAKSAILMEQSTGKILYEKNADEPLPPASITKIMTLLLIEEALDQGKITKEDNVTCSLHANSMGGSQIWFKEGEQMTVHELLKAAAIASANDASVALAEHVAGSEETFVDLMNQRASELGMVNTHFVNATGLDAAGHLSTARDIAIMSRELLSHEDIKSYSTVWMDQLRDGKTQLVNTNKLVRFYEGATGLKTGTTDGAGSCLSGSAQRGELSLIAVTMGSKTSDERFASVKGLLDFGFANYTMQPIPEIADLIAPVKVLGGVEDTVELAYNPPKSVVVSKDDKDKIGQEISLAEDVSAPIEAGQTLGKVVVHVNGDKLLEYPLTAKTAVGRMTFGKAFEKLIDSLVHFS